MTDSSSSQRVHGRRKLYSVSTSHPVNVDRRRRNPQAPGSSSPSVVVNDVGSLINLTSGCDSNWHSLFRRASQQPTSRERHSAALFSLSGRPKPLPVNPPPFFYISHHLVSRLRGETLWQFTSSFRMAHIGNWLWGRHSDAGEGFGHSHT